MTSAHPPASPAALAEPLEPDSNGERDEDGGLDEPFEPPVDDLRSPRAAAQRKPPGPLGMVEARGLARAGDEDDAGRTSGVGATVAVAPVRVVEIGGPPRGSDNSNDALPHDDRLDSVAPVLEPRLARAPAQIDEPFAPPSAPPPPAARGEEDRYADETELRAASDPPADTEPEPVPAAQLVSHAPEHGFSMGASARAAPEDGVEQESPHGFSTVFHARPSLRPSPPPPPRSAIGWWVVITLLSSIIVAALVVAVREEMEARDELPYQAAPVPPPERAEPPASKPTEAAPAPLPPPVAEPTPALTTPAAIAADAGTKLAADASVAAKPARVWKPRPKPITADAGALGATRAAPAPVEAPPAEVVPANPYGRLQ